MRSKVFLFFAAFLLSMPHGHAQFSKRTIMLGNEVSYVKHENLYLIDEDEEATQTDLRVLPSVGVFVSGSLAVGVIGGVNFRKSVNRIDDVLTNSRTMVFGIFSRYNVPLNADGDFVFLTDLLLTYARGDTKSEHRTDYSTKESGIAVSPGVTWIFSRRWAAEILLQGISYTHINYHGEFGEELDGGDFVLGLNSLNPKLGVRYYFNTAE